MKYLISLIALLGFAAPVHATSAKECVVMLHGMARSSKAMAVMDWRLTRAGYDTRNIDYSKHDLPIEGLADKVMPRALRSCLGAPRVHFVTHSMGGIILRQYFENVDTPHNMGHVVMMGPPNQGSEIVDEMRDLPGFDLFNGVAGRQLGTDDQSVPNQLGAVDFSLGVVAGNETISPIFSAIIPDVDDGKVSVKSTRVDGMKDHIILPVTHTFMMNDLGVFKQVLGFLRDGVFTRSTQDQ